jgi:uncharacterized protein (TIRG00374 family)
MARMREKRMRAAGTLLLVAGVLLALAVPLAIGGRAGLAGLAAFPAYASVALGAVTVGSWLAKGLKFWLLALPFARAPGPWHNLAISLGTDFAFCASPGGVAGYPTNLYLLRRAGLSWAAASAVVATEQVLDLAFFAVVFPVATFVSLQAGVLSPIWTDALGSLALACALGLAVLLIAPARRRIGKAMRGLIARVRFLRERREALARFISELWRHGRTLASVGALRIAALLALTTLYWLGRYAVLWIALTALGHPLPFLFLLLLQALIMHAAQWTGIPGGGGGADVALVAALSASIPAGAAATALLVWRIATFYLVVLVGAVALASLGVRGAAASANPAPD